MGGRYVGWPRQPVFECIADDTVSDGHPMKQILESCVRAVLGDRSARADIMKSMPRPADSAAFREILGRFVDAHVESDPAVLGVRMLQDDEGPHLSVAIREGAPELPEAFEGIPVRAHLREPSQAAVGPLR